MSPAFQRSAVVAGEALIDLVVAGGDALVGHTGGGPFNTARAIARLEQPVTFLGRLSTDSFGMRLREDLRADGVGLEGVVATDDPTTLALAELDSSGAARYRFYAQGTSAPGLTWADVPGFVPECAVFYVGALGLVFEPTAETLERLVAAVSGETLVALDPNCRPAAIPDVPAYRNRLDRMLARTDLLKASAEDLEWLLPGLDPVAAARELLGRGPRLAVVTCGGEGALAVTQDRALPVGAPRVRVVDTIGAGDAFGGGFLAAWLDRGLGRRDLGDLDAVVEATAFACRVAGLTCARAGASPPRLAELVD